jgi:non-heme chloroperoxidase
MMFNNQTHSVMSYIQSGMDRAGQPVNIFYVDYAPQGATQTIVLIHGWPLSHEMWEPQLVALAEAGIRCVAYDRRGFGKSSKPYEGYDYDSLTEDLNAVLTELNLTDVTLAGFSMGGGEVVRYMSKYGGARVSKVALISAVPPYLGKTGDNPDGVDQDVFKTMEAGIRKERAAFLDMFGKQFYGVSLINHPVSDPTLMWNSTLAMLASPKATLDCARSFANTDFRQDLTALANVPTLIIHGDADKTVPIEASGERTAQALPNAHYIVYEGEPHGLFMTAKDRLNQDLMSFVQDPAMSQQPVSGGTTTLF